MYKNGISYIISLLYFNDFEAHLTKTINAS